MWSNLIYMLPVSSILCECAIDEEIKMEGNVGDELIRVFKKYMTNPRLKLEKIKIHATIHATYPKGTTLWTIVNGIMTRFHLMAVVNKDAYGNVSLRFEEGISWRR